MTLDEAVSYAISFRVAASFEEDGSEVVCILLIILEENVKVDQNLLQLVINTSPLFSILLFSCLQQESVGTSQQVLSSQIVQVNLSLALSI
jgi:hypothetical protein